MGWSWQCVKNPSVSLPPSFQFVLFVTLAMFSKEQGITVLGVCFAYELFYTQRLSLSRGRLRRRPLLPDPEGLAARTALLAATGLGLLFLRFRVMGSTLPVFTNFDNPASHEGFPVKQMTWCYMVAVNAWLLLCPEQLLCDWTMGTVPLVRTLGDTRNLATLGTLATLLHLGARGVSGGGRRLLLLSLALLGLPFLPASNLFFPVGFVVAERVLYLPSMGFCLLVASGYHAVRDALPRDRRWARAAWSALFALLLAAHSAKVVVRNADWTDELSLFLSGLRVTDQNAKLFNNVGHAHEARGDYDRALAYFERAVVAQPDDVGAHINVGRDGRQWVPDTWSRRSTQ